MITDPLITVHVCFWQVAVFYSQLSWLLKYRRPLVKYARCVAGYRVLFRSFFMQFTPTVSLRKHFPSGHI